MNKDEVGKVKNVVIKNLPIDLHKILKFENLVQSGGEAKHVITEGLVCVNGEIETRKRKKIFAGDIVTFANEKIRIVTQ